MQEKYLFEYAVIRIVPKVEREEFLNVGIIMYSKQQQFLQTIYTLNEEKLRILDAKIDIDEINTYLQAFEKIAQGAKDAGPLP